MSQPQRSGSMGDELTNAAIIGLLALAGFALVLRGAGSAAAWITRIPQPTGGPASGIRVLLHPTDPGTALGAAELNAVVYWVVTGLMLTLIGTAAIFIWLRVPVHQCGGGRSAAHGRRRHPR